METEKAIPYNSPIEAIVSKAMELEPKGVTSEMVREVAGRMRGGDALFLETQYCTVPHSYLCNERGRLILVRASEKKLLRECWNKVNSSSKCFLIAYG